MVEIVNFFRDSRDLDAVHWGCRQCGPAGSLQVGMLRLNARWVELFRFDF